MLTTTDLSIPDLFKSAPSIESISKVTMEWNYNSFIQKSNTGCYLSTYSSTYDSTNADSAYDSGSSYQFFDVGGVSTTMTASANSSTITVASNTGISTGMRISGTNIPVDSYVTNINSTTITISNNTAATISAGTPVAFSTYKTVVDSDRQKYTPIDSIFSSNRPDPGIVHLVSHRRGSEIIPLESIKVSNFGNVYSGTVNDRVYPISGVSSFKYWNSVRKIKSSNIMTTVGVSNGSNIITHAAPFTVYDTSFYANKLVVKTQKYDGNYPTRFKVEYLPDASTTWTTAVDYSASDTSVLSDGILEIYFNGTSWSTTPYESNKFTSATTNAINMRGVRLSITKMSNPRIPAEVIEISPRLVLDITDYAISFNYTKALSDSSYGMPVSGIVAGNGSLKTSNVDDYFTSKSGTSIFSNFLVQGIEIKAYQTINSENIPLGTYYVSNISESDDKTTTFDFEDYFYFLKRTKSPDIAIGNIGGIETSVSFLILLDNAGITNYEFVKVSQESDDDYMLDFFYASGSQTLAEVIEELAVSSQCSVFIDANNKIKVVTKEKLAELVSMSNTDFWVVGTEDFTSGEDEYVYLNGEYISNSMSISESKIIPITEAVVQYSGIGIKRQPKAVLTTPELFIDKNVPYYNASIVNRGLSFVNTELWSIDSTEVGSDKVLLSMPYINEISNGPAPSIITTASVSNNNLFATSQRELIRTIYSGSTASDKMYYEIVLDQERSVEFIQSQKFSGHIVVDAEIIKYNGVVIDVFDEKLPENSGRFVVFDNGELQYRKNKASSGVSISCYSILVELKYSEKTPISGMTSGELEYQFVSDGRAQENSYIARHTKQTETEMTSNIFKTKLYSTTVGSNINPIGTMASSGVNFLDPRVPSLGKTKSYPGYFKVSGPKSLSNAALKVDFSGVSKPAIPIDNLGEQFITGFYKTPDFSPQRISTRMRLLERPKTEIFEGTNVPPQPYYVENRGIGGLAFRLDPSANGTTGYFIEIEEVANITADQLKEVDFKNLRFYKVIKDGSNKYTPVFLKSAWVNVSAVASESIDYGSILASDGRSYAGTSDLSVVITDIKDQNNVTYEIYWETNLVIRYTEPRTSVTNYDKKAYGLMSRSDTEAMFDYILATAVSNNGKYRVPIMFSGNSEYLTESEAAERGVLPISIAAFSVGDNSKQYEYEDFGNQIKEAKQFFVKFEKPSLAARLISLSKINKNYHIADFKYSSNNASFWVFNTSPASIGLSMEMDTPVIISGIALEEINPGEIKLSEFLKNQSSYSFGAIDNNKNKYGENAVSLSGQYINNIDQAQKHLEWIYEKCGEVRKQFDIKLFPNPLLEIGDKIRIYNSNINHTIDKLGEDKVYYVTSISYSSAEGGPEMSIGVREI